MTAPPGTVTWRRLLAEATDEVGLTDARRIVQSASGREGLEWVQGLDQPVTQRGVAAVDAMVARRRAGEPLQYVLGRWGFRSLDLLVDPRVLIPRPETEVVADLAIEELRRLGGGGRPVTAADLGTGSGALALSLAAEVVTAEVWATDRSEDALAVARANLAGLGRPGSRVRLVAGNWFGALPADLRGRLDLVVSNPPYVAEGEPLPPEVADWEPQEALVAGPRGDEAARAILAEAAAWLTRPAALVLELAPTQATSLAGAATSAGAAEVRVRPDLSGRERVLVARWA
ncbi:MAG TPA: peptide chain release factor N(5)-glutamine methyltransferase [Acidimicrobiales bacterium]|jgi:release factor glutamine methyltransferase|nr:peptide chain release factor N(5)-glutamine methyltransferase [Acidimicrobiales bacterium]